MQRSPRAPKLFPDDSFVFEVCVQEASGLSAFANGEALVNTTHRLSTFQELTV